jgi:hypothetical protein
LPVAQLYSLGHIAHTTKYEYSDFHTDTGETERRWFTCSRSAVTFVWPVHSRSRIDSQQALSTIHGDSFSWLFSLLVVFGFERALCAVIYFSP